MLCLISSTTSSSLMAACVVLNEPRNLTKFNSAQAQAIPHKFKRTVIAREARLQCPYVCSYVYQVNESDNECFIWFKPYLRRALLFALAHLSNSIWSYGETEAT